MTGSSTGQAKGTNMAVWLEWVETGKIFPLVRGQSMVIGRGYHADIHLDMQDVSRRHCQVHWDGCRVWVHDLDSRNGTYINRFLIVEAKGCLLRVEPKGCLLRLGDILHSGPVRFHLSTSRWVEVAWPTWHDGLLVSLARQMYNSRDFTDMPILADTLEKAGCQDADILNHCRGPGLHVRGCWVVDLLLGRK